MMESIGPYRVLEKLGEGGMGEVYRARDTKLDRDVAIKVLPDFLARDPERLARFEREAKVLASLNHPHIATIYGLEELAASKAIAMELVDGATVKTPLPLAEALRIAFEIAEALEAAHEKGITHRDLKPANVMLTAGGSVKVLDFGLAAVSRPVAPADHDSPTLSMGMTEAGMIMGTAAYMAPEQAAGQAVDRRADIWAFGVVIWELLTGARLFQGDSTAQILADVIRADIDFGKLPTETPLAVRQLLRRCLDRDVKSRLQWIGEARIALHTAITHPERTEVPSGPAARRSAVQTWLPWAVATTLAAGGAGLAYVAYRHVTEQAPQTVKSLILPPEKTLLAVNSPPAVSPDGRKLAFVATGDGKTLVWIRDLDSVTARSLTGTDDAANPFWSPDSQSVGFIAQGKLKRIDIAGGAAVTLAAVDGSVHGASWSPRGVILFAPLSTTNLYRVADSGGTPVPVTILDTEAGEQSHRLPWFMPDGHHFLFTVRNQDQVAKSGLYVADMDAPGRTLVLKGEVHAAYLATSKLLLFTVGGDLDSPLMAQTMDPSTFRLSGDPVRVAESVDLSVGIWSQHQFSTSSNGVLAYASNGASDSSQLAWFDRTGKSLGTVPIQGTALAVPTISPDGRTIAIDVMRSAARDIWLYDVPRGTASRLTFGDPAHGAGSGFPAWSSDGKSLVYLSLTSSLGSAMMRRPVAAEGTAENLGAPWGVSARSARNIVLSPDGRYAVTVLTGGQTAGQSTASDIWMLPLMTGGEKPRPYLQSSAYEDRPAFSPSGNWIAYSSDETKRSEIFVQSFPVPGRKYQVSVDGGAVPVWSRDGKELYFVARNRQMMAVAVRDSGGTLEIGAPKALFDSGLIDVQTRGFDVSADGRFLIPVQAPGSTMPLTLVTNWPLAMNSR